MWISTIVTAGKSGFFSLFTLIEVEGFIFYALRLLARRSLQAKTAVPYASSLLVYVKNEIEQNLLLRIKYQ